MRAPRLSDLKAFAKTALLSGSPRTAYLLHTGRLGRAEVRLRGLPGTFRFRTGTSDAKFLRVLLEGRLPPEYELPPDLNPRTIMDIGANIGGVTAALARRFPQARIFAFEPLPENAELLAHNVSRFPGVTACRFGLGARTERLSYTRSDNPRNFGGGGFHGGSGSEPTATDSLPVVAVPQVLKQLGIDRVDLIKIDTEGAEHDILTSFPQEILAQVGTIVGELHGKPRDAELLDYLGQHFDLRLASRRGKPKWFRGCGRQEQHGPSGSARAPLATAGETSAQPRPWLAANGPAHPSRATPAASTLPTDK